MAKYRVVRDNWLGYEVQFKVWWWPFWVQCGVANTHSTLEKAISYAQDHKKGGLWQSE